MTDVLGKYIQRMERATDLEKLSLLGSIAHSLTIELRGALTSQILLGSQGIYALNEIQHQTTGRISNIADNTDHWTEPDFAKVIWETAQDGDCVESLEYAVASAVDRK